MEGSRKKRWSDPAGASAGFDEGQFIEPLNFVIYSKLLIEMDEIGAAAEQDVLAVVHHLAGAGMLIGRGASANVGASLKDCDLKTRIGKRAAGGQSGKTAADDCN